LLTSVAVLLGMTPARAAGPLGSEGQPITTSAYAIDLFQGPVLDSVRVTSLAGSYAAIAEGVEGMRVNTAAPAVRPLYSYKNVDYDLSLSFTSPGSLKNTDFDNNGVPGFTYERFLFSEVGGLLQVGPWGFGLSISDQRYTLGLPEIATAASQNLEVSLQRLHLQVAHAWWQGQLVVGLGIRGASLNMDLVDTKQGSQEQNATLVTIDGGAPEVGALWAPHGLPLRASMALRSRVRGAVREDSATRPDAAGDLVIDRRYLPSTVELPWEIEAGVAYQVGERPLNVPWPLPREQYPALPRNKVLLTASTLVSGPVNNAVGVESFLAQRVERSGRRATFTPRVGLETEPVEGWLQVRVGSYLEPSRYPGRASRPHGTFGLEAKIFPWTVFGLFEPGTWWRASGFIDLSARYLSWGVSVGIWR
jgi:hypothetical protein